VSYGIRRFEFDAYLLAAGRREAPPGRALDALERRGDRWVANGALEAPALVGAGGHFCPVARRLAPRARRRSRSSPPQELELELTDAQAAGCPVDPELAELFFTEDLRGYGWLFRKGRWLNVGLGPPGPPPARRARRGLPAVPARRGPPPVRAARRPHGHAYLLHGQAPRPLAPAPGALLLGDAAGLAYPRSGEGIRPAVESGLLAARCLRELGPAAGEALGRAYARAVEARLGPRRPPRDAGSPIGCRAAPGKPSPAGSSAAARSRATSSWTLVHPPPGARPSSGSRAGIGDTLAPRRGRRCFSP